MGGGCGGTALAPMKVCMMFNLRADGTPGWSYATNVARLRLQETLGSVVQLQTAEMINPSNLNATVLAFAADGLVPLPFPQLRENRIESNQRRECVVGCSSAGGVEGHFGPQRRQHSHMDDDLTCADGAGAR